MKSQWRLFTHSRLPVKTPFFEKFEIHSLPLIKNWIPWYETKCQTAGKSTRLSWLRWKFNPYLARYRPEISSFVMLGPFWALLNELGLKFAKSVSMADLTSQIAECETILSSSTAESTSDKRHRSETWNFVNFWAKKKRTSEKYQKCVFIRRYSESKASVFLDHVVLTKMEIILGFWRGGIYMSKFNLPASKTDKKSAKEKFSWDKASNGIKYRNWKCQRLYSNSYR